MTITIEIPDNIADDIITGICVMGGFSESLNQKPQNFAQDFLIKHIKSMASQGVVRKTMIETKVAFDSADITAVKV